jgi:hypothetical protein
LYRSTDRLCRRGAPVKNLAHSASLRLLDKIAPSKFGIKHLGRRVSDLMCSGGVVKVIAPAPRFTRTSVQVEW